MERADVRRWLEAYVEAWKSYDPEAIGDLFAADCRYRYHPFDEPLRGREEIVTSWVEDDPDQPGTYEAAYEPVALDGDVAVATGASTYTNPDGSIRDVYENCFLIRFDADGRCAEFTEWFVKRPEGADA